MERSLAEMLAAAWKLHQSGKLDKAIRIYRKAAAMAPDYAEIHNNLGNAQRAAGRPADAVVSLKRAAKLKPDVATVHTNLGLVLADMGRFAFSRSTSASARRQERLIGDGPGAYPRRPHGNDDQVWSDRSKRYDTAQEDQPPRDVGGNGSAACSALVALEWSNPRRFSASPRGTYVQPIAWA